MNRAAILFLSAALAAILPTSAGAQTPPPGAPVPGAPAHPGFAADFKVQGEGPKVRGRIYGMPGRERREIPDPWGGSTLILRYDLGVAWTLMPGGRQYFELPMRGPGPVGAPQAGLVRVGDGDINDVPATRFRVPASATSPGGEIWLSREGIPLRIDGPPTPGGRELRFELDNLRIGPQNPALFELPPGAVRLSAQPMGPAGQPPPPYAPPYMAPSPPPGYPPYPPYPPAAPPALPPQPPKS